VIHQDNFFISRFALTGNEPPATGVIVRAVSCVFGLFILSILLGVEVDIKELHTI